jgi:hypothetical protein
MQRLKFKKNSYRFLTAGDIQENANSTINNKNLKGRKPITSEEMNRK